MKKVKPIAFAGPWITKKEIAYTYDATKNGFYETRAKYIKKFEETAAKYLGVKYTLGLHCCTLALHLACASIGLKKGDEVICTDLSWVATADAITYTGATPVFVDIDFDTWCIDPNAIEKAITPKTKAIMLVHMFGYPARMDEIMAIAKKHNLRVIEDAAPALGSEFKGKKAGSFGDFGCFSFQGAKIAVSGEGGILATNDKKLYERAYFLSTMGRTDRKGLFWCDEIGYQYTIANLTAALAVAQLERINELIKKKRQIHSWYYKRLKDVEGIKMIKEKEGIFSNYCYPAIFLDESIKVNRDDVVRRLAKEQIYCRPGHPRMSLFSMFEERFSNPVAARVSKRAILLPSAANLNEKDVAFACKTLLRFLGK